MGQGNRDEHSMNGANVDLEKCGRHSAEILSLKDSDKRQWDLIERIQNRLPVWATFVFGILTLTIGWLLASGFHSFMKGQ
jgi:hypothetical protein